VGRRSALLEEDGTGTLPIGWRGWKQAGLAVDCPPRIVLGRKGEIPPTIPTRDKITTA